MLVASHERQRLCLPWRSVLTAWLVTRGLVAFGAVLAGPTARLLGSERSPHAHGLLGWDAEWYQAIAESGYGSLPAQAYRFFPLLPALVRLLGAGHPALALLVISNLASLLLLALVHQLAAELGFGRGEARRAVWAAALLPAAVVTVMGYAESLFGCLLAGFLLALRRRSWPVSTGIALLAGLTRPTAVLLCLPAVAEALHHRGSRRDVTGALLAAAAPLAGMLGWLAWVQQRTGDALLPFHVQQEPGLRGGALVNPLPDLLAAAGGAASGGVLVRAAWAVLAVVVTVRAAPRLAPGHVALVLGAVGLALTAGHLSSLERYVGSAVPVALAAGVLTGDRRARTALTGLGAISVVLYSGLVLAGGLTP